MTHSKKYSQEQSSLVHILKSSPPLTDHFIKHNTPQLPPSLSQSPLSCPSTELWNHTDSVPPFSPTWYTLPPYLIHPSLICKKGAQYASQIHLTQNTSISGPPQRHLTHHILPLGPPFQTWEGCRTISLHTSRIHQASKYPGIFFFQILPITKE